MPQRLRTWGYCLSANSALYSKQNIYIRKLYIGFYIGPYHSEFAEETSGTPAQQVAAGPDEGALVEQIAYLTSWPQSTETTIHMDMAASPEEMMDQQRGDLIQSLKYMVCYELVCVYEWVCFSVYE